MLGPLVNPVRSVEGRKLADPLAPKAVKNYARKYPNFLGSLSNLKFGCLQVCARFVIFPSKF